ncbi:MAG: DUF4433 domain-containing protein [SAR202 cluster bacterium]|nr:DUF4433 domain-containing protein [SAR202 cluster bacterium]
MPPVPNNPKIFHITHLNNLPGMVRDGGLWSDAKRIESEIECEVVGMSTIKQRRLTLPVRTAPTTFVGDYVPFYLCERSIMLYILYRGNHPELTYKGGQGPMVHLMADLQATAEWAKDEQQLWSFTDGNASARYTNFYDDLDDLDEVNWEAVTNRDFRDSVVQEGKQAEFLVHEFFPWHLIEKIAVINSTYAGKVHDAINGAEDIPAVSVERSWYY